MEAKEAKEIIEKMFKGDPTKIQFEALDIAYDVLDKQIPKRPNLQGDGYADGYMVYDIWICPSCGKSYEVDCDRYKYCPECGQHLDLSEIN